MPTTTLRISTPSIVRAVLLVGAWMLAVAVATGQAVGATLTIATVPMVMAMAEAGTVTDPRRPKSHLAGMADFSE